MADLENPPQVIQEHYEARERESDEEVFNSYLTDLGIAPEMLKDKFILDIGADSGQFIRFITGHNLGKGVALEIQSGNLLAGSNGVQGKAEELPFSPKSFDLILADASVPNMQRDSPVEKLPQILGSIFNEMIRTLKDGGEIRLAPIAIKDGSDYERILETTLQSLKVKCNVSVEKIRFPEYDIYAVERDGTRVQPLDLREKAYRIIIKKKISRE